jgi:hypothetical protein
MSEWQEAYKPAAPARLHLLLAAGMWTVVGALLLFFGTRWLLAGTRSHALLWLALGIVGGGLKGHFALKRSARSMIARIRKRGDGRCIGGFLSWRSWLLVALMATAGRVLRGGLLPEGIVGFIYALVGTALLLATGQLWNSWLKWNSGA